jgi:hypothetical protein
MHKDAKAAGQNSGWRGGNLESLALSIADRNPGTRALEHHVITRTTAQLHHHLDLLEQAAEHAALVHVVAWRLLLVRRALRERGAA